MVEDPYCGTEVEEFVDGSKYYVKQSGQVPQDVVEVSESTAEEVRFFPAGGGPQYRMTVDKFAAMHRPVGIAEYVDSQMYALAFDIDGMFGGLPGYSNGQRWNGWACPYFPKSSCNPIVAVVGKGARYDEAADSYVVPYDDGSDTPKEFDHYPSQTISDNGKTVTVWTIGNGCRTWQELG